MIAGDPFVLPQRRESWLAIGYLVVIGSIAVFLLYLMVLWYWGGDARRVRVRDHRVRDCSAVRMARRRTGHLGLDAWRALGPGGRVYVGALGPGRLKDSSLDPAM
jgi:hypothetical protein